MAQTTIYSDISGVAARVPVSVAGSALAQTYLGLCAELDNLDSVDARLRNDIQKYQIQLDAVPWWDPYTAAYYQYQIDQLRVRLQRNSNSNSRLVAEQNAMRSDMDRIDSILTSGEGLGVTRDPDKLYQEIGSSFSYEAPEEPQDARLGAASSPSWMSGLINTSVEAQNQAARSTSRSYSQQESANAGRGVVNPLRGISSQNRNIGQNEALQLQGYLGFMKAGGTYTQGTIESAIQNREAWFQDYWNRMMAMQPSAAKLPRARTLV